VQNQLSLVTLQQQNCNFVFEFSGVTQAADGSITMNVWYPWNVSATVTLTTGNCAASGTIPTGIYCGPNTIAAKCNGDIIFSQPWSYGNVTVNANGTTTAFMYTTTNSGYYTISGIMLSYNAASGIVTSFDYFGRGLGYSSTQWCSNGALQTDLALPTVGAYCGSSSVDGTNATLFVLPGGEFTLTYWPPVVTGTPASLRTSCTVIGSMYFSTSTQLTSFNLQEWNYNCYLGGSSYYAPPRVRFTSASVNNATGVFTLTGQSWTTTSAAAVAITVSFGPQCSARNDQSSLATPFYTRGQYGTWATGSALNSTMIIAGGMYAVSVWRFGYNYVAVASGTYTPRARSLAMTDAGFGSFTDYYGFYGGNVYNATYSAKNVVQLVTRFSSGATPITSGSGYTYMVTPLAYSGATAADVAYNGASPNGYLDNKSDDKSKTGIIIGVIIAVVVVIAIVAFIVVRSNSGRSTATEQQGGQDYRPMNGV